MPKMSLTDRSCREYSNPDTGQVLLFDSSPSAPAGFALRVTPGSKAFVMNYMVDGRQRRATLGRYPELSLKAARVAATKMKGAVYAGADPLVENRQRRAEADRQADADRNREHYTLGALLSAYADGLESSGKVESASAVRNAIGNHVRVAHPKLWAKAAAEIEPEDGVAILSPLLHDGKARTAGKVRSYMRAAYSAAVRARLDPSGSTTLRNFKLRANPLSEVAAITSGNNARDRALSVAELRAYWQRAKVDPLLALHLLTGAQRIEQLARATIDDVDEDAHTLRLWDGKGRRTKPRSHVVPLLPDAEAAMDTLRTPSKGAFVFTCTNGATGARYDALRARLAPIVAAMEEAGEAAPFTAGDLRRTVETRLAALGVSQEVRGQLQSHGLGGVQQRHYDRHSYQSEKREALERLYDLMTGKPADVVPIGSQRKSAK